MGGKTVDNILALDLLLYDGTRMTVGPTDAAELAVEQPHEHRGSLSVGGHI